MTATQYERPEFGKDEEGVIARTVEGLERGKQTFRMVWIEDVMLRIRKRLHVRYSVKIDRFYAHQSEIRMELWTENGWVLIHQLMPNDPKVEALVKNEKAPNNPHGMPMDEIAERIAEWLLVPALEVLR